MFVLLHFELVVTVLCLWFCYCLETSVALDSNFKLLFMSRILVAVEKMVASCYNRDQTGLCVYCWCQTPSGVVGCCGNISRIISMYCFFSKTSYRFVILTILSSTCESTFFWKKTLLRGPVSQQVWAQIIPMCRLQYELNNMLKDCQHWLKAVTVLVMPTIPSPLSQFH